MADGDRIIRNRGVGFPGHDLSLESGTAIDLRETSGYFDIDYTGDYLVRWDPLTAAWGQSLLTTILRIEAEVIGFFFINVGEVPSAVIDRMNADPELIARVREGLEVEGIDLRGVWGLKESSGSALVDSVAEYGEEQISGSTWSGVSSSGSLTLTDNSSTSLTVEITAVGSNIQAISAYIATLDEGYPYGIFAFTARDIVGEPRIKYMKAGSVTPTLVDHEIVEGANVIAVETAIDNYDYLRVFFDESTLSKVSMDDIHLVPVEAIQIQEYLSEMRVSINSGPQKGLMSIDPFGRITGAPTRQVQTHGMPGVIAEGTVVVDGSSSYSLRYFIDAVQNLLGGVNDNHATTDSIATNNTLTEHGPGYIEVINTAPTEESYHTRMRYYATADVDLAYEVFTHLTVLSGEVKVRQGYQESVTNGKVYGFDPLGLEGQVLPAGDYFATGEFTGFMFETMFDATEEHTFHILLKMELQEIIGRTRQDRVLTQVYDISSDKSYLSIDGGPKRIAEAVHPLTLSLDGDTVPIGPPVDPVAFGPMAYTRTLWSDERISSDATYALTKASIIDNG